MAFVFCHRILSSLLASDSQLQNTCKSSTRRAKGLLSFLRSVLASVQQQSSATRVGPESSRGEDGQGLFKLRTIGSVRRNCLN